MVVMNLKDVWRFVPMELGVQCVMTTGMTLMLVLSVLSWDILGKVCAPQ